LRGPGISVLLLRRLIKIQFRPRHVDRHFGDFCILQ
jgi:hypothetical protein